MLCYKCVPDAVWLHLGEILAESGPMQARVGAFAQQLTASDVELA